MNDTETEKILTQTIIVHYSDVTTCILKSFAYNLADNINEVQHEANTISMNHWSSIINVFINFISTLPK